MYTRSKLRKRIFRSKSPSVRVLREIYDRQGRVYGVSALAYRGFTIIMVGCGGIGVQMALAIVMKGVAVVILFDRDEYDRANGNRQMCVWGDMGKNKAIRLGKKLVKYALAGTEFICYPHHFDDALALGLMPRADVIICGVDNNQARLDVSDWADQNDIPCVHIAVDLAAEAFVVFIQLPGEATLRCAFPNMDPNIKMPCRVPSVIDPIKAACGYALYALDSILQKRPIKWNYRHMHLAGVAPDKVATIKRAVEVRPSELIVPKRRIAIRDMGIKLWGDSGGEERRRS